MLWLSFSNYVANPRNSLFFVLAIRRTVVVVHVIRKAIVIIPSFPVHIWRAVSAAPRTHIFVAIQMIHSFAPTDYGV
jgi:hypothetical protein